MYWRCSRSEEMSHPGALLPYYWFETPVLTRSGGVQTERSAVTCDTARLTSCNVMQMDLEGVPPTTIREVSLLKVLGRSNHIVKCVPSDAGLGCDKTVHTRQPDTRMICRLLGAEPIDEDGKSVLYLVSGIAGACTVMRCPCSCCSQPPRHGCRFLSTFSRT